jgi:hypothetical protein
MVGVVLSCDQLPEALPVDGPLRGHQLVLVGQRPPHVREGGQSPHYVGEVSIVSVGAEIGEPPPVIGVEEDEVCLDAERVQVRDALLEVPEEAHIEAFGVPLAGVVFREGVQVGVVLVEDVALREHAHAHFGERGGGKRVQGALLELVALMCPRVRSRPERHEVGPRLVGEPSSCGLNDPLFRAR